MQSWKKCALLVSSQWLCGNSCTWWLMSHTSCAQVNELPQSHCGDNREGTFFSWLHIYFAHLASVRFWALCVSWITYDHIYIYTFRDMFIYSILNADISKKCKIRFFCIIFSQDFWNLKITENASPYCSGFYTFF